MYFKRIFYSGGREADFRRKANAEFVCSVCGYIHYETGITVSTYRKEQEICCPKCNSYGKEDKVKNLIRELEDKKQLKSKIEIEIDNLCKQIETMGVEYETIKKSC